MANEKMSINKADFLRCYGLTGEMFEVTGLEWAMLEKIYVMHAADMSRLQKTADYVLQRLREVGAVHSLKVRIKHPEHLMHKIIRKKIDRPDLIIDVATYSQCITDLIGIRALHLFKDQWQLIHDFVTTTWELHEKPIAYVRKGDPEAVQKAFSEHGCNVERHTFGYRSVHYLLKLQPEKQLHLVELQVRTLFEEGWSEIDHQIRYPNLTDNPYLAEFLTIFNRLAGSADEMGTFIKGLSSYVSVQEKKLSEKEAQLNKAISKLQISESEKEKLQARVKELRESSQLHAGLPFLTSQSLSNYATTVQGGTPINLPSNLYLYGGAIERTCIRCFKPFTDNLLSLNLMCPECRGK